MGIFINSKIIVNTINLFNSNNITFMIMISLSLSLFLTFYIVTTVFIIIILVWFLRIFGFVKYKVEP